MRGLKKNRMGRGQTHGQTDRHTDTRICQLLDPLGPEGRVGEKNTLIYEDKVYMMPFNLDIMAWQFVYILSVCFHVLFSLR